MGLQHTEIAPKSFLQALAPGYLGDPDVVARLLGQFLAASEVDLYALATRAMPAAAYPAAQEARIHELAAKFSGDHPDHPGIAGFHGNSLPAQLQAALGPFWRDHRGRWGDDAVAVLLEWLLVRLVAHWKAASGSDEALQVLLRPDVRAATDMLLGRAQRA